VTSVIGLESPLLAVLACLGFSQKNQRSAFGDFCNTIGGKADIDQPLLIDRGRCHRTKWTCCIMRAVSQCMPFKNGANRPNRGRRPASRNTLWLRGRSDKTTGRGRGNGISLAFTIAGLDAVAAAAFLAASAAVSAILRRRQRDHRVDLRKVRIGCRARQQLELLVASVRISVE
jgi:hypothetical protein